MILYFTGTGNSRYVARILGQDLNDEVVSLNDLLKSGKRPSLYSDAPFVVVSPNYAWNVPKVVYTLLSELTLSGSDKMYFIFTSSGNSANAEKYASKLIKKIGKIPLGTSTVYMPGNYIAFMQNPEPEYSKQVIEYSTPQIHELAKLISQGKSLPSTAPTPSGEILSVEVNLWFRTFWMKAKGFYSTDKCISCGKCVTVCPLNNISLSDGHPTWGNKCTHCMACISYCPTEAIEFKSVTQGKNRYHLD